MAFNIKVDQNVLLCHSILGQAFVSAVVPTSWLNYMLVIKKSYICLWTFLLFLSGGSATWSNTFLCDLEILMNIQLFSFIFVHGNAIETLVWLFLNFPLVCLGFVNLTVLICFCFVRTTALMCLFVFSNFLVCLHIQWSTNGLS